MQVFLVSQWTLYICLPRLFRHQKQEELPGKYLPSMCKYFCWGNDSIHHIWPATCGVFYLFLQLKLDSFPFTRVFLTYFILWIAKGLNCKRVFCKKKKIKGVFKCWKLSRSLSRSIESRGKNVSHRKTH